MDSGANSLIIPPQRLLETVAAALIRAGAVADEALVQADMLTEAELRGHPSHGMLRLPILVERLEAGLIVSGTAPDQVWRSESVLAVNGHRGFGPVVGGRAVAAIIERASTTGIALASVTNAGHLGMMAPYVERMASARCVGIALTVSEALVHAWGGATGMVGTNPIGIAVPTDEDPLVLDMSTSAASVGKVLDYAARGEQIPLGWAIDAEGRPTTDPTAAIGGAISPFGGAKGYALGVALEAMVGLVTGGAYGRDVHGTLDVEYPSSKGDLFIAVSLDRLGLVGGLGVLTDYLDEVRRSGLDGTSVAIPGDRARRLRIERLRDGVPVDRRTWQRIELLAGVAA